MCLFIYNLVLQVILTASPIMPYRVLGLMRDIMFRTNYARDARMTQIKINQFRHFFAMILSKPRSLKESVRGIIRLCLGERPTVKVERLPLPTKLKDYVLYKESILKDMYDWVRILSISKRILMHNRVDLYLSYEVSIQAHVVFQIKSEKQN